MRPLALPCVLALACGGSSNLDPAPLEGVYQVTGHTVGLPTAPATTVSCSAPGATTADPPFIALVLDHGFLNLQTCTTADLSSCTFTLVDLMASGDHLSQISSNTQTGGGTACALYHSEYLATPGPAGALHVELRDWSEFPDPPPSDCTLDLADALADSDVCRMVEIYDATQLP